MSGYSNKKRKAENAQGSRFGSLLRNPWLSAGTALILDTIMLVIGLILSRVTPDVEYTLTENAIEHSQPFAFFGIIAAVVLALDCVLVAFIIAGAFLKKRRAVQLTGAVVLLLLSLVMIGVSALTAIGIPPRLREYTSYSDTDLRLIIEEDTPYTGSKTVAFYLTDMAGSGKVVQLAKTTIRDVSGDDDRYKISWISDEEMMIGFQDGDSYRTLQIPIDRTIFPEVTEEAASEE